MRFLQAEQISALASECDENRVGRRRGPVPIVRVEICIEGIFAGHGVVKAHQAKIFPNFPLGITDGLGGSGWQAVREQFGAIRCRPEVVGVWQHACLEIGNGDVRTAVRAGIRRSIDDVARHQALPGLRVGHERNTAYR